MSGKSRNLQSDLSKVDAHALTVGEYDEIPELTDEDMNRPDITWRVGGKAVSETRGRAAFSAALKKQKVNIALDPDVVEWFKQQAGGRGYQTLINATLREAMQHKTIEETLRRVIREELDAA